MREVLITPECVLFIEEQDSRVFNKFYQIVEIMSEVKVVNSNFVKKLTNTDFYELRIKAGTEIRIIIFSIDNSNFSESTKIVCLNGFQKKSTKDYTKALRKAKRLLDEYL